MTDYAVKRAVDRAIKGNSKAPEVVRRGVIILDVQFLSDGDLQESLRSYGLDASSVEAALETAIAAVHKQGSKSGRVIVPDPKLMLNG